MPTKTFGQTLDALDYRTHAGLLAEHQGQAHFLKVDRLGTCLRFTLLYLDVLVVSFTYLVTFLYYQVSTPTCRQRALTLNYAPWRPWCSASYFPSSSRPST